MAMTKKKQRKAPTDRSFDDWEQREARRSVRVELERIKREELEDDCAEFDPSIYYERDETVGE